jgi:glycosyltransferase involved in cell wall biosynthesis
LFSWVGFKTEYVYFTCNERHVGQTKWNYRRLFNFALDGITSFSTIPLRIWGGIGFGIAAFAFLYALWIIIRTTLFGDPVQGFPTLMVTVLFLGGLQLIGIGVIGEYLGRLYHESKQRPLYIIHHEINANPQRPRA